MILLKNNFDDECVDVKSGYQIVTECMRAQRRGRRSDDFSPGHCFEIFQSFPLMGKTPNIFALEG